MKLSILICTMSQRESYFKRLMERLTPQLTDDVEIKAFCDDGEMTIGAKRNALMQSAIGDYVAFVDDDDLVSINYITKVLSAVDTLPDCVGMEGIITFDGNNPRKFIHSLKYKKWFEKRGIYYRNPNHLNPIKREIALKEPFPEKNMGEDADFSKAVLKHLKTEIYVPEPIYYYEYRTTKEA